MTSLLDLIATLFEALPVAILAFGTWPWFRYASRKGTLMLARAALFVSPSLTNGAVDISG